MLNAFQLEILRAIAGNRSPNSHIAGGAALNRDRPRMTGDIDIFHDGAAAVEASAAVDVAALKAIGCGIVDTTAPRPPPRNFVRCDVERGADATRLEWAFDSAVRFQPAVPDPVFGYRLGDLDLAVNKVLALAGRSAARDVVDIAALHGSGFPLVALAWAAPGKDPGFTPAGLLDWLTRNASGIARADWDAVGSLEPVDPVRVKSVLLEAVAAARSILSRLPPGPAGRAFLGDDGKLLEPTPGLIELGSARHDAHLVSVLEATPGGALAQIPPE